MSMSSSLKFGDTHQLPLNYHFAFFCNYFLLGCHIHFFSHFCFKPTTFKKEKKNVLALFHKRTLPWKNVGVHLALTNLQCVL